MLNNRLKRGAAIAVVLSGVVLPLNRHLSSQAQEVETNTTVEDVEDNLNQLLGETVTVRGAVEDIESGASFTIKDEDFFGLIDDAEVLVINRTGALLPIRPSDDIELQVTGEVGQLVLAEVEAFGLVSPELYAEYENQPVIFAESVALSPSPDEIFDNPESYYYRSVAVKGEVENLIGTNAFTIEDDEITDEVIGSEDLLVINVASNQGLEGDQGVIVTGTVRPFVVADFERDYGLSFDEGLRSELEVNYTNRPVIVTTGVYPLQE
ncbi:MAG: hypothetical protein ACFB4I_03780 [Cyanophyceae cyanobacterium]